MGLIITSTNPWKEVLGEFAAQMKAARLAKGLSQKRLAHMLKAGQSTVSNLESCKVSPNVKTLCEFASVLNKRVEIRLVDPSESIYQ